MAIITGRSGKFNISTANEYINGYVEWIETYDSDTYATTLKSTVSMKAYLHRTNSYNQDTYSQTDFYRKAVIGDNVINQTDYIKLTIKPGGSYTEVFSASGEVQHSADGSATIKVGFQMSDKLNTTYFRVAYTETTATLTTFAVRPTISINGAGSSPNNRKAITSSGASLSISLGSLGGRSSTVSYSLNGNDNFVSVGTYTANGTYNITIPASIISSYTNTNIINMYVQVANNMGGVMVSAYLLIDSSVKPSVSTVSISSVGKYSSLNGLLVKQLTKPIIRTTASGTYGSSISSYVLASLTGFNTTISETVINSNYTHNNFFEKSGNFSASVYVRDSRGIRSDTKSVSFTVIDYGNPSMTLTAERCNSAGQIVNDGTYCKLSVNYNIFPITSGNQNYNTKKIEYSLDGTTWKQMQVPSYSGTTTAVFNNNGSDFAQGEAYTINVRLTDINTVIDNTTTLPTAKVLESKHAGGDGITWGRVATKAGYHIYGDFTVNDKNMIDLIYPVGSIYLSISTINPANIFGIGTWRLVSGGTYLIGYDPNNAWFNRPGYNSGTNGTGGSWNTNDTALTLNQIPGHQHYVSGTTGGAGGHQHTTGTHQVRGGTSSDNWTVLRPHGWSSGPDGTQNAGNWVDDHTHSFGAYTDWQGGSQGHNHFHVSPYLIVCVWYREA